MTKSSRKDEPYRPRYWKWRFKLFFVSLLDRFPLTKRLWRPVWRKTVGSRTVIMWRYRWRQQRLAQGRSNGFNVDKTCWMDPRRIRYCSLKGVFSFIHKGEIIGGDWDRLEKSFEDEDVQIAFKERFMEGRNWEDTSFYWRVVDEIRDNMLPWGCKNKSDFDRRCQKLDRLFQNIKRNGYKSQSEILSEERIHDPLQIEDEITVNIGRSGDLLLNNGRHRLSIAKLLGVQRIPVKITLRHPEWIKFRKQILLYAKSRPGGKIYQPITNPDLQDIPFSHDLDSDKFAMIYKNLSVRKGRLLDIGTHWCYFCHKFEEVGFDCYAVENNSVNVHFLEKLKRAENRHFKVISKSIFEYEEIECLYFHVVLALNIFHHFLKNRTSYCKLLELLKKLRLKEMYVQAHNPVEPQVQGAYKNYSEGEFVKFILKTSRLTRTKFIGTAMDGGKLYKLY